MLGLARSNTKAENALFTARHSLVSCKSAKFLSVILWTFPSQFADDSGGWVLRNKFDQEAAEILLRDMEVTTGWNMTGLIQTLREQWNDEDSNH